VTTKNDEDKLLRSVVLRNANSILIARRRAEQRNEFYLAEGQRLAHMGSWALNASGFFEHWSAELFQIFGLDPTNGAPTLDEYLARVDSQDREFMAGTIEKMLLERTGCDVKQRILRPDGALRHIRWVGVPVFDGGVFKGYVGTAMDVTEQEHLTQELRRREVYLAEAQRLSHTGSFGWYPATGEIFWSEETFRIFEYDRSTRPTVELVLQRVHPEDKTLVEQLIDRASRDAKDFDLEYRLLVPSGSVKHLHVVAHAARDESGKVEFVGSVMDITGAKRAEERLRQDEMELRQLIDIVPQHIFMLEPDGRLLYANRRDLEYTGLTLDDILAPDLLARIYHPDDLERLRDEREHAIARGIPWESEARVLGKDGQYRWFLIRLTPLRDEQGRIIRWYGTRTDIEDRKQAEEIRTAQARQAAVRADVSAALSMPSHSGEDLRASAEAIVRHLDAAFARIWTLNQEKNMLELQASAGMYTHLDGPHSRIPVGKLKLGLIAQDKKPYLTNDVLNDSWVTDKAWAQKEGMISFAGYPLIVQDRVVGVMAMFARRRLSAATLEALASVADSIAQGIERKQTEEKIRQSEAHLAEAQGLSHTGSFVWKIDTGEIVWSDESFRMFQYDRTAKPTIELILRRVHPEDIAFVTQTIKRVSRGEKDDLEFEHRLLMPDGFVKHVHVVARAVRDKAGNLECVGSAMDVTEQRQARAALEKALTEIKQSEDRLRLTLDTIPALAWCTLPDGSAEVLNQRWLDYTGLSAEKARNWGWTVALHDEDSRKLVDEWRAAVASGEPFEAEARFRGADGKYRWFLVRAVPLRDERGNIVQWYGTNTDIEDRKRAEEELHRAQSELAHVTRVMTMGELTASIAHEINQPLAAIVTNANASLRWLAGESPNLDEARDALGRILRDGNRAGDVIARIRALVKKSGTEQVSLDINEVVQEVVGLIQSEIQKNGVVLRMELAADLPRVLGDRVQLQQVILNLVMNGIEAMASVTDRRRELFIRSRRNGSNEVLVAVQDYGVGLQSESLDHLFKAFFTTKPKGMGMGLAISRSIIEAHGGKLWAVANDGRGATFQFTLRACGKEE
jgi:PAS domain S-box-containing protein